MIVRVSLHTHTDASTDGSLPEEGMRAAYAMQPDPWVTAVTDHDVWSDPPTDDRIAGIERTIDADTFLHVVELDPPGGRRFRYLAHPARPFPENTREQAAAFVRERGLDGVGKFNRGDRQYEGHIDDAIELSSDDAHNPTQIGLSFMTVDVPEPTATAVMREIRAGRATLHNRPDLLRKAVGSLRQGLTAGLEKYRDRDVFDL